MMKGISGPSADPRNPLKFATKFWDRKKDADAIDRELTACSESYRALLEAVRDHGVLLGAIMPQCGGFVVPKDRQAIVFIDDQFSLGPDFFDAKSIGQFLKRCESQAILVVSRGAKRVAGFLDAAQTAVNRRESVLLIETTPEHHEAWRALIHQISPRVKGSHIFVEGEA